MVGRWDYLDGFKNRPFKRPSKEQLFQEYLERLSHPYWFRDTLIELPHLAAFDQLIQVWKEEETAITLSSGIHGMDAMNLLAAVHVSYQLKKLERTVTELEARLDWIEHGKPRRTPEDAVE